METPLTMTCHECKNAGIELNHKFATWDDLVEHRAKFHALHYVHGVPFWMAEIQITRDDYFWVARTIQDKAFLRRIGWVR